MESLIPPQATRSTGITVRRCVTYRKKKKNNAEEYRTGIEI